MKKYSLFHPYLMSFFSRHLYFDVGQNWRGIAAFYLLVLLFISWIPVSFLMHSQLSHYLREQAPAIVKQIPNITIKQGVLSIDKPVPYVIKDDTDKPIIIIDTGEHEQSSTEANVPMLITANKIFLRKNTQEERVYNLNEKLNFTLGAPQVQYFLDKLATWGILLIFPFLVIATFVYRILQSLVYGAIGMLFSAMVKANISYQQSMRLAIVAMTPGIILATILSLLGIFFPYEKLLYFVISMFYLFFAIGANKQAASLK